MKNRSIKTHLIISVIAAFIIIITAVLLANDGFIDKTYSYGENSSGIASYVDELDENLTSASFVLHDIEGTTLELR